MNIKNIVMPCVLALWVNSAVADTVAYTEMKICSIFKLYSEEITLDGYEYIVLKNEASGEITIRLWWFAPEDTEFEITDLWEWVCKIGESALLK